MSFDLAPGTTLQLTLVLRRLGFAVPHLALQNRPVDEANDARNQDWKGQYDGVFALPAKPLDQARRVSTSGQHLMTFTAARQRSLSSKPGTCLKRAEHIRGVLGCQCPTSHSQLREASVGYHVCRMHRGLCARMLHAAKALAALLDPAIPNTSSRADVGRDDKWPCPACCSLTASCWPS